MSQIVLEPFLPEGALPLAALVGMSPQEDALVLVNAHEPQPVWLVWKSLSRYQEIERTVWSGDLPVGNVIPNPSFQGSQVQQIAGWTARKYAHASVSVTLTPYADAPWFVKVPSDRSAYYRFVFQPTTGEITAQHRLLTLTLWSGQQDQYVELESQPFPAPKGIPLCLLLHCVPQVALLSSVSPRWEAKLEALNAQGQVVASWNYAATDRHFPNAVRLFQPGENQLAPDMVFHSIRRVVFSSDIVLPSAAETVRLTLRLSGPGLYVVYLLSVLLFPSAASFWLKDLHLGDYPLQTSQPSGSALRSGRLHFLDTPFHEGISCLHYDPHIQIDTSVCYSHLLVSGLAMSARQRLQADRSVWDPSKATRYGSQYTGDYVDLVVCAVNGRVIRTVQITREHGTVLRAGLYTDPLPVIRDAGYAVRFPVLHPFLRSDSEQNSHLANYFDVPRRRYSTDTVLLVVQGLDASDNVTETPFVTPLYILGKTPSDRPTLIDRYHSSLYVVPNSKVPEPVRFTHPATVKARVGIEFLQYYERDPNDPQRPIYCVPYLGNYYVVGSMDECLSLVDPKHIVARQELLPSSIDAGFQTGWSVVSGPSTVLGWQQLGSGQWRMQHAAALTGRLSGGVAGSIATVYEDQGMRKMTHRLRLGVTASVTLRSDLVYLGVKLRMRVNPGALNATAQFPFFEVVRESHLPDVLVVASHFSDIDNATLQASYPLDTDTLVPRLRYLALERGAFQLDAPYGDWFELESVLGPVALRREGEEIVFHVDLAFLPRRDYEVKPGVSDSPIPLYELDYIQFSLMQVRGNLVVQKEWVPVSTTVVELPASEENPPRLGGWHITPSGDYFLKVYPGVVTRSHVWSAADVSSALSDHEAWTARAVQSAGWHDRNLVLVYRIPPGELGRAAVTVQGKTLHGFWFEEEVPVHSGRVSLSERAVYLAEAISRQGQRVNLQRVVDPPGKELEITEIRGWETATIRYLASTEYGFYTGYTNRFGRFVRFLPRTDRLCLVEEENSQGEAVPVARERVLYTQGATLYLLPFAVALWDEQGLWASQPDGWLYAHQFLPKHISLLRHTMGLLDSGSLAPYRLPLVIGWMTGIQPMGVHLLQPIDVRRRGGGYVDAWALDAHLRNLLWDVSDWDGALRSGAGHVVIQLPRYLLEPQHPRGGYSEQTIRDLIRKYLPAGITFDVEFVETSP